MNSTRRVVANTNLELYINFDHDFAVLTPNDSKRGGLVVELEVFNIDHTLAASSEDATLYKSTDLVNALKEESWKIIMGEVEGTKAALAEQLETIKTLAQALEANSRLNTVSKY